MKRPFTLALLLFIFISSAFNAQAQVSKSHTYSVVVSNLNAPGDVKVVNGILKGFDSSMMISYSQQAGFFKVRTAFAIDVYELGVVLANSGYHLVAVSPFNSIAPTVKALPDGFPQKQHTGNELQDAQDYQLAKQQWIQDNPGLYMQLTAPSVLPQQPSE